MRQADIKKNGYYANGERVRFVLEIKDGYPPQVKYLSVASKNLSFPNWCDLSTFAKWSKRMVAPAWFTAVRCPDCEGWCDEVAFTTAGDVTLSCPQCGSFSEEGTTN